MFYKKQIRRLDSSVNAGSMADIAFLLLIFFLVSTTILSDKGIMVKLPRLDPDATISQQPDKNVLSIKINAAGQLLVEGQAMQASELKAVAMEFIMNPRQSPDRPSKPAKAIVSLQNDRGTAYKDYLLVYNELKAAYNQLWDEAARAQFQRSYDELSTALQQEIRNQIPLVISEAEPSDHSK